MPLAKQAAEHEVHFERALAIARDMHAGQFRADKETPYVTHVIDVSNRVWRRLKMIFAGGTNIEIERAKTNANTILVGRLVGLFHDWEDNRGYPLRAKLLEAEIPMVIVNDTMVSVIQLSSTDEFPDYLDYILSLKDTGGVVTLVTKQEDMNSNFADTARIPHDGRRKAARTKYLLAHYILFNSKPEGA